MRRTCNEELAPAEGGLLAVAGCFQSTIKTRLEGVITLVHPGVHQYSGTAEQTLVAQATPRYVSEQQGTGQLLEGCITTTKDASPPLFQLPLDAATASAQD